MVRKVCLGLGVAAVSLLCGCMDLGSTEPVLGGSGNLNAQQPAQYGNAVAAPAAAPMNNRELASIKADMDALREDLRVSKARIIGLEQDNVRKDAQIKQLQTLLEAMDRRFAEVDTGWRNKMNELSSTIDSERSARRKELENFSKVISTEIEQKNNSSSDKDYDFVVEAGDTLGAIAKNTGVSVEEIMRYNNLKSTRIYVKQKLKIPRK